MKSNIEPSHTADIRFLACYACADKGYKKLISTILSRFYDILTIKGYVLDDFAKYANNLPNMYLTTNESHS